MRTCCSSCRRWASAGISELHPPHAVSAQMWGLWHGDAMVVRQSAHGAWYRDTRADVTLSAAAAGNAELSCHSCDSRGMAREDLGGAVSQGTKGAALQRDGQHGAGHHLDHGARS